ncbi:PD-(D/E)XK nuclease family protein [Enterococcus sp. LJL120]
MSLKFILGTGSRNHRETLISEAKELLTAQQQVFFLVPNFNKFEQEREILQKFADQEQDFSAINLQVFSLQRLAWYYLQQSPDFVQSYLSESSSGMIFRKILATYEQELTVFRGEINKTGFISQLYTLYRELLQGNLTSADLKKAAQSNDQTADQQLKLQDLSLIMAAFEETIWQTQLVKGDLLDQLVEYLQEVDLSQVHFLITGFSHFSAKEIKLISLLMEKASVTVSLLLDKKSYDQPMDKIDLFYDTSELYFQLYQLARKKAVPISNDLFAAESQVHPDLVALQKFWETSQSNQAIPPAPQSVSALHLMRGENLKEEISWIGRKIRQKVIEEGYRYQDIQVLVRDQDRYGNLIAEVFKELALPVYLDESVKMEQHPLVEFLSALFAIKTFDFRLNDIMRLLRTELLVPEEIPFGNENFSHANRFRDLVDITENIALAYNFQGYSWKNEQDWHLYAYDFEEGQEEDIKPEEQKANFVRNFLRQQLLDFFANLENSQTGQEAAAQLFNFLATSGVKQRLLDWRSEEINQGNLEAARNHEQTWNTLVHLLEEYVSIYGTEVFEWEVFQEILEAGMENANYGMIPSALDQVRINNLELARPNQAKITFAVGLNNQVFPQKIEMTGLLSSEDKVFINHLFAEDVQQKYLFDATTQGMNREPFAAYLVFLSATEELYLSYAGNQDTDKNLQVSPYVENIANYFGLDFELAQGISLEAAADKHLGTYRSLLGDLTYLQRLSIDASLTEDKKALLPQKWQVLKNLLQRSALAATTEKTFKSLDYANQVVPLSADLVEAIYGNQLKVSVSRLENFFNCEYKYFATYGLALKERDIYGLSPAATGDFFHDALDRFLQEVIQMQVSLATISDEEVQNLTEQVLIKVLGEARFTILNESNRMKYIRYQLKQTIHKVSWALKRQSQATGLSPMQTELLFGSNLGKEGIAGKEVQLNHHGKLAVRGIIDRIDVATSPESQQTFLSVVDYKSSKHSFEIWKAYYGLTMQLLTYLDVALMNAVKLVGKEDVKPAGAYYLHVRNPELKNDQDIAKETMTAFKYDGLFVNDPEVLEQMAPDLEKSETSNVFPVSKNAKDLYSPGRSQNKFYTEDELNLLRKHNEDNMKTAGNRILSGEIALNPAYINKNPLACNFCPFRSVCNFDVLMKGNDYHRLEKLSKEEVLKRIGGEEHE